MAKCKIITYDLLKIGQNYDGLITEIKRLGEYNKICESCWIVKTSLSSAQIRDKLVKQIDDNDRLFVAALTGEAAWKNTICRSTWLIENL